MERPRKSIIKGEVIMKLYYEPTIAFGKKTSLTKCESTGAMLGSKACHKCSFIIDYNENENWVKCLRYDIEKRRINYEINKRISRKI